MNPIDIQSFSGVWKRTKLYKPRGCLGPEDEQTKTVLWFQTSKGIFIDVRVDPALAAESYNPLLLKSFAGVATYDSSSQCITWNREIDYRPTGAPDIGLIQFLSNDEIEEDGVLPGDDYKEIWRRVTKSDSTSDFVAKVTYQVEEGPSGSTQFGYFIVLSDRFAFTLSKPQISDQDVTDAQVEEFFNAQIPLSTNLENYLKQYIAVVGNADTWLIDLSLDSELVGQYILPTSCEQSPKFKILFENIKWEILDGCMPSALADMLSHRCNNQ